MPSPKIGIIMDKNKKDLREPEEIKKRWQEYTAKQYKKKKVFNDPVNQDDVVTHLEPDILEWEVKWA